MRRRVQKNSTQRTLSNMRWNGRWDTLPGRSGSLFLGPHRPH
jgi:hypothetical protein